MEELGLQLKWFVACAYKVIHCRRSVAECNYSHFMVTGMSLEKLNPTDTSIILSVYLSGTEALPAIESNITRPLNGQQSQIHLCQGQDRFARQVAGRG